MENELKDLISEIKSNDRIYSYDEATTKQAIILRLFSSLGWKIFNTDEVKPEYSMSGRRVDYALRINNINKVFIEVKQIREHLEKHQEQLLSYSFQEGVKLAILTNGITWWFYLPLNEGSWEQRRFYTIDLVEQAPRDIIQRFVDFLSKENIDSGKAITNAENFYRSQQKRKKLKEALPKAWYKIISEPDELLIELIIETTEKSCGLRLEENTVEAYLKRNVLPYYQEPHKPPVKLGEIAVERKKEKRKRRQVSKKESYRYTKPREFSVSTSKMTVKNWKEVLLGVCEILSERHPSDLEKFLRLDKYFSRDPRNFHTPVEISSTGVFVETNRGADDIVRMCKKTVVQFGYSENEFEVLVDERE